MSRKKKQRRSRRGQSRRGQPRALARPQRPATPAEVLADQIIGLVVERAPALGGTRGDAAGQVMFGAFVYGFRRFVAIRRLVARDEGTEAFILARSLLSIVARAAYVDSPQETEERHSRYERFHLTHLHERLKATSSKRASTSTTTATGSVLTSANSKCAA